MNITDYLFEKAKGIITRLPEINDNEKKGYTMADDGGVECEVGELLYSFIRTLKPQRVLTTGIYTGISDMYIAQGLKDNGYGTSTALEFEQKHFDRAQELWKKVEVNDYIHPVLTSSLDYYGTGFYQFMFLDTEPSLRFKELIKFYPYLDEGGYVFIHDLHRHLSQQPNEKFFGWPFGKLPDEIKTWLKERKLVPFYFPTPRGISCFYKPHPNDYEIDD